MTGGPGSSNNRHRPDGFFRRGPVAQAAFSLSLSLTLVLTLVWPMAIRANPEGGQVTAGSASIAGTAPSRLDIRQTSDRAIIDWQAFDIGAGEHTDFQQPSSDAVTLNRVLSADPSSIQGQLTANGRLFLVNPNGILFGEGARVDVGGLLATTADILDRDFMAGRYVFGGASDNLQAAVINRGEITVAGGGSAVLVAPSVRNEGLIRARLGRVDLAGANTFTLDFNGDGLLQFDLGAEVAPPPPQAEGQVNPALVSNSGVIAADGGVVTLTARAADVAVDRVINMDGVVQARTAEMRGGSIILSGGDRGIVAVSGTLNASGPETGQTGGSVKVLGDKVGLFDGARIDVSGAAGGGQVLVGGNLRGQGPEANARRTVVAGDARIVADALEQGNGGQVVVWADEATAFQGKITARGGTTGGDGGFVEVSGKEELVFRGQVDLRAADGHVGTLLLDPINLQIRGTGVQQGDSEVVDDGQILAGDGAGVTFAISEEALESLSEFADILLEATNDIAVYLLEDNTLDFSATTGSVTFRADADGDNVGNFLVLGEITILTRGGDITIEAATLAGDEGLLQIISGGGDITINSHNGGIPGSLSLIANSSSDSGAGGTVSLEGTELVSVRDIDTSGPSGSGDIRLTGTELDLVGSVFAPGANLLLQPYSADQPILVGGDSDTGALSLDLTAEDIHALVDGFQLIAIGRNDGTSPLTIDANGLTINDALLLQSPGAGGAIAVNGPIHVNGHALTLNAGDAIVIKADIATDGGNFTVVGLTNLVRDSKVHTGGGNQSYTGTNSFDADFITDGGDFTVTGDTVLEGDTSISTDGGDIGFHGALDGAAAGIDRLDLSAGTGDILFDGDVGGRLPLGAVSGLSARDIDIGGKFFAGDTDFVYSDYLVSPRDSLDVLSLRVDPGAKGATLFGNVAGAAGNAAARLVEGPVGDPDFTINGCTIGVPCEPVVVCPRWPEDPDCPIKRPKPPVEGPGNSYCLLGPEWPEWPEISDCGVDKWLIEYGPHVPSSYAMNSFTINAFVKGDWPMVLAFAMAKDGIVQIDMTVEGAETQTWQFVGTGEPRQEFIFKIPENFGTDIKAAQIAIHADDAGLSGDDHPPFRLYGIGAGPKAVGSVAIHPVNFFPENIRVQVGQEAAYSFLSHSTFADVVVQFMKVEEKDSEWVLNHVGKQIIQGGVDKNEWIGKDQAKTWDGKDEKGQVSAGLHDLQVRVWDREKGDWVLALSHSLVRILQ